MPLVVARPQFFYDCTGMRETTRGHYLQLVGGMWLAALAITISAASVVGIAYD